MREPTLNTPTHRRLQPLARPLSRPHGRPSLPDKEHDSINVPEASLVTLKEFCDVYIRPDQNGAE